MVIRQFDVFPNPSTMSRATVPYVVILQSEYAGELQTSIVAPLYRSDAADLLTHVTVDVRFEEQDLVASIPELAAINNRSLRKKAGTAITYEDELRRALDRLFTGF